MTATIKSVGIRRSTSCVGVAVSGNSDAVNFDFDPVRRAWRRCMRFFAIVFVAFCLFL
jgi:hypothetical protein